MRSSICAPSPVFRCSGDHVDVRQVPDRAGALPRDRHPVDRVQPHRAHGTVVQPRDPRAPVLRRERPRPRSRRSAPGRPRTTPRRSRPALRRARTEARPARRRPRSWRTRSTACARLTSPRAPRRRPIRSSVAAPQPELGVHHHLHHTDPAAGAGRSVQRGQQVRRPFDPLVAGAGRSTEPADVDRVRRDEQLPMLGQVALRQEGEHVATAVVHHDHDEVDVSRGVPQDRPGIVEEGEVPDERDHRFRLGRPRSPAPSTRARRSRSLRDWP